MLLLRFPDVLRPMIGLPGVLADRAPASVNRLASVQPGMVGGHFGLALRPLDNVNVCDNIPVERLRLDLAWPWIGL